MLTPWDVRRLTGVPPRLLDHWSTGGVLRPLNQGRGKAVTRLYSVAVRLGLAWRQAGVPPGQVRAAVRLVARLGLARLRAEAAAGNDVPCVGPVVGSDQLPGLLVNPHDPRLGPADAAPAAELRRVGVAAALGHVERGLRRLGLGERG